MQRLKTIAAATVLVAAMAVGHAAGSQAAADDEAAIKHIIASWDQGWKDFDATLATRDYAPDADWTNAFGVSRKGQPEIYKFLADFYKHPGTRSRKSTPSKTTIRFLRPEVAVASSYRETVGQKTASGAEYPTRKTHDQRVFVRDKGKWSIISHLIMDEKEVRP
jgi:uncharacterized protein (TIGR02246 family)